MKRWMLLAAVVLACAGAAAAQDQPYEIDAILPLTGPVAFLGKGEASALAVVQDFVNKRGGIRGRPVH